MVPLAFCTVRLIYFSNNICIYTFLIKSLCFYDVAIIIFNVHAKWEQESLSSWSYLYIADGTRRTLEWKKHFLIWWNFPFYIFVENKSLPVLFFHFKLPIAFQCRKFDTTLRIYHASSYGYIVNTPLSPIFFVCWYIHSHRRTKRIV